MIFKILTFKFRYYSFCIPSTHNSHGARWLLFLYLLYKCSFPQKKKHYLRIREALFNISLGNGKLCKISLIKNFQIFSVYSKSSHILHVCVTVHLTTVLRLPVFCPFCYLLSTSPMPGELQNNHT